MLHAASSRPRVTPRPGIVGVRRDPSPAKQLPYKQIMKLSDYVFQFVADQGVKHVFLVTGGGAMHLNASLADEKRITPICNSHEQAAAMCAESYAKAVNGLGVAVVTTGPGSTNAITGVAGAWLDSTPTLFLSGQVKRPDRMFDSVSGAPLGVRQLGVQEIGRASCRERVEILV